LKNRNQCENTWWTSIVIWYSLQVHFCFSPFTYKTNL